MPPRKIRGVRKNKPKRNTKPRAKRTSGGQIKTFRKMLAKTSEKKRFYIAPIALNNGDLVCVAPRDMTYLGGTSTTFTQPFSLGQQFANGAFGVSTIGGWCGMDMTPYPIENNGFSGREGSAITLQSSYMQFKFTQQSTNTLTPIKIRMIIVQVLGAPQTASGALQNFFLNSALPNGTAINSNAGIIDYNSNTSPDQRGQYKVLYNKSTTLWQDNIDAGLQVRNHVIKMKYNRGAGHAVRFLQNSTTVTHGQLMMFFTADAGNISGNAFTGNGSGTLVNNAAFSGAEVNFNICHYYTDL